MSEANQDGVTHVNIYSRGKTRVGRLASNFAKTPFNHPVHGYFASVEAAWYWWTAQGPRRDEIRAQCGWRAKRLGRDLGAEDWPTDPAHRQFIEECLQAKSRAHPEIVEGLREMNLPITHYYVFYGRVKPAWEEDWTHQWWAQEAGLPHSGKNCSGGR